jgi:hypothetical protein
MGSESDASKFVAVLKETQLKPIRLQYPGLILEGRHGVSERIRYNDVEWEMLDSDHEYTFPIPDGDLLVSLQFYENVSEHYRLFCYSKINGIEGMLFSVNLTTQKDADGMIFLNQKIKFSEGRGEDKAEIRRQKQFLICNMLKSRGFDVTDTNELIMGIFDTKRSEFLNTTPAKFLMDFLYVSILKGHFMGNKGYQLKLDLPDYKTWADSSNGNDGPGMGPSPRSASKRQISLSLRYKVLERDQAKCVICGRSPRNDGITLHVDHVVPFSCGGLTILGNLQTLCSDCNLGKGNRSDKRFAN